MSVKKAVVLAAGLASRLMPATKAVSKPMLPLVDKPTIQYLIDELVASGITDIAVIINEHEQLVRGHFSENKKLNQFVKEVGKEHLLELFAEIESLADLKFIVQEKPLGPGDAVLKAKKFINNEPFALLYADDIVISKTPATKQLIDSYNKCNASVVAVTPKPESELKHFGVIKPADGADINSNPISVKEIVEKPKENAPSNLAVVGRYIITPEILHSLEKTPYSAGNELYITGALEEAAKNNRLFAHNIEGIWYTTGKKIDYVKTVIACAMEDPALREELKEYIAHIGAKK